MESTAEAASAARAQAGRPSRRDSRDTPKARRVGAGRVLFPLAAVLAVLLTAARLVMGLTLHVWVIPQSFYDDYLLVSYSFPEYGSQTGNPVKMAKNQAMGLFYRVVHASGISITVWFFLMWLAAALLVALALWRFFHSRWLSLAAYLYVLWNPLAFEIQTGTRMYRNALFAPTYFSLIALLAILLTVMRGDKAHPAGAADAAAPGAAGRPALAAARDTSSHPRRVLSVAFAVIVALAAGLAAFFAYDLKEDGIAVLPLLFAVLVIKGVMCIRENTGAARKAVSLLVCCVLPAALVAGGAQAVRSYNKAHFGVRALNTRCAGQIGQFVYRLYAIRSKDRTPMVWAPADAVEQAWAASPALQEHPELLESIENATIVIPAGETLESSPLSGDMISWQVLISVEEGAWHDDEAAIDAYFARVNAELDQAFDSGVLQRYEGMVQPTASLPPRSPGEIKGIAKLAADGYWCYLTLNHRYNPTAGTTPKGSEVPVSEPYGVVMDHTRLLEWVGLDPEDPDATPFASFTTDDATRVALRLAVAYRWANVALLVVFAAACVLAVRAAVRRRGAHSLQMMLLAVCLLAYGAAYTVAIAWFCYGMLDFPDQESWLNGTFSFGAGIVTPFLIVALLMGLGVAAGEVRGLAAARAGEGGGPEGPAPGGAEGLQTAGVSICF